MYGLSRNYDDRSFVHPIQLGASVLYEGFASLKGSYVLLTDPPSPSYGSICVCLVDGETESFWMAKTIEYGSSLDPITCMFPSLLKHLIQERRVCFYLFVSPPIVISLSIIISILCMMYTHTFLLF